MPILRPLLGIPLEASRDDAGVALLDWLAEHLPAVVPLAPLLAVSIEADVEPTRRGGRRAPRVPPSPHAAAARPT